MLQHYTDQKAPLSQQLPAELEKGLFAFCDGVGPMDDIVRSVLTNSSLAVALTILHINRTAKTHRARSLREQRARESRFAEGFEGHSKKGSHLDTLVVEALAQSMSTQEIERAVDEYLQIVGMLDSSLEQQVTFDIASLEKMTCESLSQKERKALVAAQRQAIRWTFLGSGMTHSGFLCVLERLSPSARRRVEQLAPAYC